MKTMLMDSNFPLRLPEVWAGIECTINRVNDVYYDQLEYSNHYLRHGDIERLASLGIKALRYPILWEHYQKQVNQEIDWSWTARQLEELRFRNVTPIAGLVHHGSGPAFTGLLNEDFPEQLARYATKVAQKFPWLEYYTPINEPLTTARFSGLYGFWYPHHRNDRSFVKMLISQLKGIVLAMQSILEINPSAKLIQTEDLCKIHSTSKLKYQSDFENERRWLTFDLLCGKVDKNHYLWKYLVDNCIPENELYFFIDSKYSIDTLGLNYYITSERFLDDKIENYPDIRNFGNGRHQYVDIEAVRASDIQISGVEKLCKEVWERYFLPIAITEVHLNCTRDHQLRWLKEVWDAACRLHNNGVNVRAVTAWSALGAYNWSNLLTLNEEKYESGLFDIRNNSSRPTAVAKMVKQLANKGSYDHPILDGQGWWSSPSTANLESFNCKRVILIVGKTGTLGTAFARICELRDIAFVALGRTDIDISSQDEIMSIITRHKPWAVINATGYVSVDAAETNVDECYQANTVVPTLLAACCRENNIQFVTFSSDLVFDGLKGSPYTEEDRVHPLNIYGKSKVDAERMVFREFPSSLIIRTSAFFGPWDRHNFVYFVLNGLENNSSLKVAHDIFVSPTYVPDLVNATLDLMIDQETGIWHLANDGVVSWADLAHTVADKIGDRTNKIEVKSFEDMDWVATRPKYSALTSRKGNLMPTLEDAIRRLFAEKTF